MKSSGAHGVDSERLAQVMRQLDRLDRELLPKEFDAEAERRDQRETVAQLALAVSASAASIPDVLVGVALTDAQRDEFLGLASALEARAVELSNAARTEDTDLHRFTEALRASCTACHDRFRVLPLVR